MMIRVCAPRRSCLLLAACLVLPEQVWAQAAAALGCGLEAGPTRAVARIIDGETIGLDDGVDVRLIGALAPRASDGLAVSETGSARDGGPGHAWPPEAAARETLSNLIAGQSIALAFAGRRNDRYGRVLAHVFMHRDGQDIWVQGRLVEDGLARAYSLPGSDACMPALLERERRARQANRGLWAHAAYQIRPADRPGELERYRGTFQVVRGRVERARGTRSSLAILELGSGERPPAVDGTSQRGAFRVVWNRDTARTAGLEKPGGYADRNILVRGWIEGQGGPQIALMAAGQIETEDGEIEPSNDGAVTRKDVTK